MRKLKIMEHISLDGVIQHSADDDDFPYGATGPRLKRNTSLPTVRKVLNGAHSRALDRTSSQAFAATSRRMARTLSSRAAPR
jgi:hypothetical protein